MRRAVEHRALMAIAIGDLGVANTSPLAVAALDRGWTLYAHTPARGTPIDDAAETTPVPAIWGSLRALHERQISHGDLRANKSPSTTARCCSAVSTTPSTAPPTHNSNPTSLNCW